MASERRVARWASDVVSGPGPGGAEQPALEEAVDVAVDGLADIPEEPGLRSRRRLTGHEPIELKSGRLFKDGRSVKEIAAKLGRPVSQVRTWIG